MDHNHLQAMKKKTKVLQGRKRKWELGFKKMDNFEIYTPYTTSFTSQSQELMAQEI